MKKFVLCFFALVSFCTAQAQIQLDDPDKGAYYIITNDEVGFATIAKFNSDGTPDLSYGTAGVSEPINIWEIVGAAIQSDGKIVLAGMTELDDIHTDQARAWVNPDGSIFAYERESETPVSYDYISSFEHSDDRTIIKGYSESIADNFGLYQIRVFDL